MAVKEENTRITLNISKELNDKVERLAKLQGTNKNAVICNLVEVSINAQLQLWEMMKNPNSLNDLLSLANKFGVSGMSNDLKDIKEAVNNPTDEQKEALQKFDKMMRSVDDVNENKLETKNKK